MSPLRADVALAVTLVRADLAAGRRPPGAGAARTVAAGALTLVFAALVAMAAVGVAATVHGLVPDARDAARGAVDLLFAGILAAGLVSPLAGGPTSRLESLCRATAAPVGVRVRLLAACGREALAAPVAPTLALAVGGAAGLGAAEGPLTALLGALLALSLGGVALGCGVSLSLWSEASRRPARWRLGIAVLVLALLASATARVPATGGGVTESLAAIHAAGRASFLLPSWWSTAPLATGGAAWWPLALFPLAMAWLVWGAPAVLPSQRGARGDASSGGGRLRSIEKWPGRFGALFGKDCALLRRDRGLHAVLVRHGVLALLPLAAVAGALWLARGDADAGDRLVRSLRDLPLVTYALVVAWSGPATLMAGTDGGGGVHVLSLPVRAEELVAGKALAWARFLAACIAWLTAVLAFLVLVSGAQSLGVAGVLAWVVAVEGIGVACAGAGAGIVAAVIWPSRSSGASGEPAPGRTGAAGLIAGFGSAGLTLVAVLVVGVISRAGPIQGLAARPLVGLAVGAAVLALGIVVAASLLRARRETVAQALARPSRRR